MSNLFDSVAKVADEAWDGAVGGWDWIKSLLLGEFQDHRPLSVLITEMLVTFVPGVVIVTSARDAVAVTLRLAKHPERREQLMEWVVLCACLITIALPIAMAGAGLAAAGVGAAIGGIAGSELGAALRAVMLLLAREATELMEVIKFLQKFVTGNIMTFLKAIKFAKYEKAIIEALVKVTDPLIAMCKSTRGRLENWLIEFEKSGVMTWLKNNFDTVRNSTTISELRAAINKLASWEAAFYGLQRDAVRQIPLALAELDARLTKLFSQAIEHEAHTVASGAKAEKPTVSLPVKQEIADATGNKVRQHEMKATAHSTSRGEKGKSTSEAEQRPSIPQPPEKPPKEPENSKLRKGEDPKARLIGKNRTLFEEIYAKAPAAKIEIDNIAKGIATKYGGKVAKAPIKSEARAIEKIVDYYDGNPRRIKDLARNTIVVPESKIASVVGDLQSKGANVNVITPESNLYGYSGVNSTLKASNGITGEIQVNTPQMIYAKESEPIARSILGDDVYNMLAEKIQMPGGEGHKLYEVGRVLPEGSAKRTAAEAQSRDYYNAIRGKFDGTE